MHFQPTSINFFINWIIRITSRTLFLEGRKFLPFFFEIFAKILLHVYRPAKNFTNIIFIFILSF